MKLLQYGILSRRGISLFTCQGMNRRGDLESINNFVVNGAFTCDITSEKVKFAQYFKSLSLIMTTKGG